MSQSTNTILMIRPYGFRANEQTATSNYFQKNTDKKSSVELTLAAQKEFDTFVDVLKKQGVNVIVYQDTGKQDTPDSIFPNNWLSFHEDATVALYPMMAENRRLERQESVLELVEAAGFKINNFIDYTGAELEGVFLEGTGSIVLDRVNRKAYCALSPRADEELFIEFCEDFEYTPVIFEAYQTVGGSRKPIYHTNVLMCVADRYAVVCLDAVDDKKDRRTLEKTLKFDGKKIIALSEEQMHSFAGNMLQVQSQYGKTQLVMSQQAHDALRPDQLQTLKSLDPLIVVSLPTIESCGGGSARCMMAEVFLPTSK